MGRSLNCSPGNASFYCTAQEFFSERICLSCPKLEPRGCKWHLHSVNTKLRAVFCFVGDLELNRFPQKNLFSMRHIHTGNWRMHFSLLLCLKVSSKKEAHYNDQDWGYRSADSRRHGLPNGESRRNKLMSPLYTIKVTLIIGPSRNDATI